MNFTRRTAQVLHEDHQATIAVIDALEQMIAKAKRTAPDVGDPQVRQTLEKAATAIEGEISSHFTFEETELFTRLEENGDVQIGAHLRAEHSQILPIGQQVSTLAQAALADGFSNAGWSDFKTIAAELVERMFAHIQKEEMALLPMLEDLLDPETDMKLSTNYTDIQ